ncbi:hypothetical protein [Ferrimonas gelatinilytica]|uniref:Uncharacterized protein n=1 Tax=Ferrimonas gelatinilytica TaxID=1255257 RepID=A0ABP9RVT4_9GAMM
MTDLMFEIYPALFSTPVMHTVVTGMLTVGLAFWLMLAIDYVRLEKSEKLWKR